MKDGDSPTGSGFVVGLTFVAALVVALVLRGPAVVGIAALFLVFVPLEKVFALRPQKMLRRGLLTDLTHLLVNNLVVTVAAVALVVVVAIPLLWLRAFDVEAMLPPSIAVSVAVAIVTFGSYWGHRLTHQVPFLWRFHAVHHSIEEMDWVASGRLHPLDQAFTHACSILPLVLLGYDGGVFGGTLVFFTLLALFQHANTRLRFPVLRWVINTPEWHHWHHARDTDAIDKNFGIPFVDKLFGTAYLPSNKRPSSFGIPDPVPQACYLSQLAYPFTRRARDASMTLPTAPRFPVGTRS